MGSVRACGYSPIVVVRASRHHRVGGKNGLLSLQPQGARGHSISWVVRAAKGPPLLPPKKEVVEGGGIISACFVGLLTGLSVVIFNNVVHEIRDLCWDGLPSRGGLRVLALENKWERIILIPTCGGLVVSLLNVFRSALEDGNSGLKGLLKAVAAAVTLGTGNSLGPEGPSVDIGTSVAKGVASLFDKDAQRELSLKAAGSAAGISSGFNAAVAGCFFAVESVLWPSPAAESSLSLTNTTSTVILSAVIASVVSEIGLGSEPAFTIPNYDFRSPTELPLYLLLGIFCGVVSLSLSWCTSWMIVATDKIQKTLGMPKAVFPVVGGFSVGVIALIYPEVLYWGFENVDTLLETRAFVKGLDVDLLLQLIAVKVVATSLCRASGLVGGYYAPSLFIGAATGMAYGKLLSSLISHLNPIFHLSGILDVASPQAYALVGMAATLAGVCEVPLTAVLLLFELTQDYRIVLPLLGAVGVSSWITSWSIKSKDNSPKPDTHHLSMHNFDQCITKKLLVSQAMKTQYVTVLMNTLLTQVVTLMLAEKQSCAIIVDDHNLFIGLLTLGDIQEFCKLSKETNKMPEELKVSQVCSINDFCETATLTPMMNLHSAELIMNTHGANQLPVISEDLPVGILDRECINIACRALATTEYLSTLTN
ncbi:putative CBS domain, chloride channel, voltage gated, chloride channel, core [Helianthus anomalus]